jgi:DNA transposition AAA+ family ATPase
MSQQELLNRERIRGASRMIAEGTDAAAVTDGADHAGGGDVETFINAHKISKKELAKRGRLAPGVISELPEAGSTPATRQVAIDLENWLVEEEQRRARPQTTQFVWTNVAMEIKATANYCLDKRKIGLVYGGHTSGLGKTTALRAIPRSSARAAARW